MISPEVMQELLSVRQVLHYLPASPSTEKGWSPHEQQLFWVALTKYPQGPWTSIAEYIGTKTTRQAMTHAQKLRQKLKRWNKRLRSNPVASELMDSVSVSADGTITYSAGVGSSSTEDAGAASESKVDLESKDGTQHGISYSGLESASASAYAPPLGQSNQHAPQQHYPTGGMGPPVPMTMGPRPHLPASSMMPAAYASGSDAGSNQGGDSAANIPHDLVDALARELWEEELDDDDITEEQLKELDDEL